MIQHQRTYGKPVFTPRAGGAMSSIALHPRRGGRASWFHRRYERAWGRCRDAKLSVTRTAQASPKHQHGMLIGFAGIRFAARWCSGFRGSSELRWVA